eukprot:scaffold91496_cov52-Cyclotella_meneghiniana.AAC.1
MHQHMYIDWQEKVEIGIHCLQWSPGADFGVICVRKIAASDQHGSPQYWVCFGSVQSLHSSWTVPMHQHMYIEWQEKVEIGIHCLQWSPEADFKVMALKIAVSGRPMVHPNI